MLVGFALNLVPAALYRAQTRGNPYDESATLVTGGVFHLSRNPLYLGFVLILVGIVPLRSLTPWAVLVAFAFLVQTVYVKMEEQKLATRFGSAWEQYARTTRRWL